MKKMWLKNSKKKNEQKKNVLKAWMVWKGKVGVVLIVREKKISCHELIPILHHHHYHVNSVAKKKFNQSDEKKMWDMGMRVWYHHVFTCVCVCCIRYKSKMLMRRKKNCPLRDTLIRLLVSKNWLIDYDITCVCVILYYGSIKNMSVLCRCECGLCAK